ncbi:ribonuclease H-like domain-containing protein [Tanacetum coccineum]
MRMEQYLTHTDYALWEVIVNGDAPAIASASAGTEGPIPPKTAEQKLARKNELKAKSTLLLAIPDEHLLKFHGIKDAKTLWEAIKARFGGNKESKKMQKTILKQQYENFAASRSEGLDKTYDRSLPSAWNNIALIMRNKSDLDTLSMDDLYNNLKVYESEIKVQSSSSSNSQNVAFVSSENTSSTNEAVNTAHEVSTATSSLTYADDVMFSFFANQSNSPQLDNEDLEQIDTDDLEEMDLKWQVAMLTMRVECYNCYRRGHFARECRAPRNQGNRNRDGPRRNAPVDTSTTNALVVQDGIVKDISIKDLKNQLEEALKEKDDLKLKLEKFEDSSKNLTKLINSQISTKYKASLGYDSQINENEVVHSVFNSRESDVNNSFVNDRFKTGKEFHVVPPPYTGNYIPLRPDLSFAGLDDSVYKTKVSETITTASKTSKDNLEKPKTVRPSAPIIEDWDTDSDNDSVFRPKSDQTKPKFTKINFVKSDENVKYVNKENTHRQVEYLRKIVTKSGQVPVNTAKQSSPRAATSISTARPVNTATPKPKVNDTLPTTYSYFKAHSPVRRSFNKKSAAKTNNFKEKINTTRFTNVITVGPKAIVNAAEGNRDNVVKSSACWIWRPKGNVIDHISKDSGSFLKDLTMLIYKADSRIFDSGCSRHMTGNKSSLTDYQEIDGGFVAFRGSPKGGKITGKGKNRTGKLDFEDGKQHKASYKTKLVSTISQPLQMLHMDLFGPTSVRSISHKTYCLVVTDDFSRFSWVFFLATKDETPEILKNFITGIKNQIDHKVKTIRCDNGTEFKNRIMNEFYEMKGIRREFSVARTPQVLVIKPHNKTPYELFLGRKPTLSFMRPFGCPVIILNTLDHLGTGPNWMFDIDTLTMSMNYQPVFTGNQTNGNAGTKANIDARQVGKKTVFGPQYALLPFLTSDSQGPKSSNDEVADDAGKKNEA